MVARDTKVGILGVVLLVGVYVLAQTVGVGIGATFYETRETAYAVEMDGELKAWGRSDTDATPTGACPGAVCPSRPAFVDLDLTVEGLPNVGPDLEYLVYLAEAETAPDLFLGALEPQEGAHTIDVNRTGEDGRSHATVEIRLAAGTQADEGSLLVDEETVGPLQGERPPPMDLATETMAAVQNDGWRCCGDDAGLALTVVGPGPVEGLRHCTWLMAEPVGPDRLTDEGVRLVPAGAPQGPASLAGCASGDHTWAFGLEELEDAQTVLVTIEASSTAPPEHPQGFAMLHTRIQTSK